MPGLLEDSVCWTPQKCRPLIRCRPHWFNGIIAGGDDALRKSIEGAEDQPENAITDLKRFGLNAGDVLIGISTSGAARYVQSAIEYARSIDAKTVYLICNEKPFLSCESDVVISVDTGARKW